MSEGKVPARVTVTLKDGAQRTTRVFFPKGCRENPITPAEVYDRARRILGRTHEASAIETWISRILRLPQLSSIDGIML
jgi:2-methylcitrate dehydratase PrpD